MCLKVLLVLNLSLLANCQFLSDLIRVQLQPLSRSVGIGWIDAELLFKIDVGNCIMLKIFV